MLILLEHISICSSTTFVAPYAPINVKPVGGWGGAGKGWGFDKFYNFLIKFPRVGNER